MNTEIDYIKVPETWLKSNCNKKWAIAIGRCKSETRWKCTEARKCLNKGCFPDESVIAKKAL